MKSGAQHKHSPADDAARIAYGRALYAWRTAEELFLVDVARLCGVSIVTVSKWERGESSPNERHRHALDRAGFEEPEVCQ